MSTTFYDDMKEIASDVLAEFLQGAISYVKLTPGNGPIDNPGPSVATPYAVNAVAKGVSFKFVSSGAALSTDLTVVMPPIEGVTRHPRDFVRIDGVDYKIVQDISPPSAGVRVVWKFIVRKGIS